MRAKESGGSGGVGRRVQGAPAPAAVMSHLHVRQIQILIPRLR